MKKHHIFIAPPFRRFSLKVTDMNKQLFKHRLNSLLPVFDANLFENFNFIQFYYRGLNRKIEYFLCAFYMNGLVATQVDPRTIK